MKLKVFLVTLAVAGSVAQGEEPIKVGDPVSVVLTTLGQPLGKAEMDGTTLYLYDVGNIVIKDGKVVSISKDFVTTSRHKRGGENEADRLNGIKQKEFEAAQKAKGLVFYKSQWMTPEELANAKKIDDNVIKRAKAVMDKAAFLNGGVRYSDILLSPEKYPARSEHALRGIFYTIDVDRKSFEITQGSYSIEVKYSRLPKKQAAQLLNPEKYFGTPVEVRGAVVKQADSEKYYIDAKSLEFYTDS